MIKVTFKNVGQGDSIILEWEQNGESKIGIVDCNLLNSENPVLTHISNIGPKEIEFIILSHPHKDHFSGFRELLQYCREKNICIKKFFHTAQTTPDYLKSASRSVVADNELFELFVLLKNMKLKNEIKVYAINDNPLLQLNLGNEFVMEILAPSSIETDKFIRGVNFPFDEEESTSNPNANWLSTVLKISNNKRTILLTSDVESSVLNRLAKEESARLGESSLILVQAPHHGSKHNLSKAFWKTRKRDNITPLVVSVGKNGHGHPSPELINFFNDQESYEIVRTDIVIDDFEKTIEEKESSAILDSHSTLYKPTRLGGDKVFTITGTSIKMT